MVEIVKDIDTVDRYHSWLATRFIDTAIWIRENRNLAISLPFNKEQVYSTLDWRGIPIIKILNAESLAGDVMVNLEVIHASLSIRLSALFGNGVSRVVSDEQILSPGSDVYATLTPDLARFENIGNERFVLFVEFKSFPGAISFTNSVTLFGTQILNYSGADRTIDFYGLGVSVNARNDKGITPPNVREFLQGIRLEPNRLWVYPYLPDRLIAGVNDYTLDSITMQSLSSFKIKSIFVDEAPSPSWGALSSFPWRDDGAARAAMQGGELPRALMALKAQQALRHNWDKRAAYFSNNWFSSNPHASGSTRNQIIVDINATATDFIIAESYSEDDEDLKLETDYDHLDVYLDYVVFGKIEFLCLVKIEQFSGSGTLLQTDTYDGAVEIDGEDYLDPAEPGGYGWATQAMISLNDVRQNDLNGLYSPQELRYVRVRAFNQIVSKQYGTKKVRISFRPMNAVDAIIASPSNLVMVVGGWIKYKRGA